MHPVNAAQVLRYTLYGKERSTFLDASFLKNDWWQRVRDLFNPPSEVGEDGVVEEEEELGGEMEEQYAEEGAERRKRSLLSMRGAFGWLSSRMRENAKHAMLDLQ